MPLDFYLKKRNDILTDPSAHISDKAKALTEILTYLDYDCRPNDKDEQFHSLDPRIQDALEELWGKYYAAPKQNGRWSGEPCDSTWIPDDSFVPPNKSYSNLHALSWRDIKRKHSFSGLRCDRGRFRFDEIAHYSVTVPDFASLVDSPVRTALHEAAFARLARKLGKSVEEVKAIKESAYDHSPMGQKNLVWHEDTDCLTLYLVPQEIHGNITHFGGIALCQILKNYDLV